MPDSSTRISGAARARPADHAEVHADFERLPNVLPSHFPLPLAARRPLDRPVPQVATTQRAGKWRRKRTRKWSGLRLLRRGCVSYVEDERSSERGAALGDVGERRVGPAHAVEELARAGEVAGPLLEVGERVPEAQVVLRSGS